MFGSNKVITFIFFGTLGLALLLMARDAPGLCNDTSRLATADALVNHGTLQIDHSFFKYTCDRIHVDGHFYSDKPPVLSLFYAAGLWGTQTLLGLNLANDLPLIYQILAFFFAGVPFCLIVFLLARESDKSQWPMGWGLGLALLFASTSQLLVYATVLNSHIVAALLLLSAWVFYRDNKRPFYTALFLGLALVIDPLSLSFGLVWAAFEHKKLLRQNTWVPTLMGLGLPILLHGVLCFVIAGNPVALNLNPDHFAFAGATHTTATLTGVGLKHESFMALLTYGYHSVFGDHGFFIYNLVALCGVWAMVRVHGLVQTSTRIVLLSFAAFLCLTIFFSTNHSGDAFGNRWHVLFVPLLLVSCFQISAHELRASHVRAPIVALFLIWGGYMTWVGLHNPWTPNLGAGHSFWAQQTDAPPYDAYELTKAKVFLQIGHPHEARAQGELALHRNPNHPEAWGVVVTSAIHRQDRSRLEKYSKEINLLPLPEPFKSEILAAIRQTLNGGVPSAP